MGSQLTYFSPFAIILAGGGFWRLYKEGFSENGQWEKKYLFFTSFPIIILFSLNSFFSSSFKPHWPALGYIGGFLAAGSLPFMTSGWKKIYKINLCLCGLMIFVLIGQTLYPILPKNATFKPNWTPLIAATYPPGPDPITSKSKLFSAILFLIIL